MYMLLKSLHFSLAIHQSGFATHKFSVAPAHAHKPQIDFELISAMLLPGGCCCYTIYSIFN